MSSSRLFSLWGGVVFIVLASLSVLARPLSDKELKEMHREIKRVQNAGATAAPKPDEGSYSYLAFSPGDFEKKHDTGFDLDRFFGTLTWMQQYGQYDKRKPMPLLRKTIAALENNEFDESTAQVIVFYFTRLTLANPLLIADLKDELQRTDGGVAWSVLCKVLWYAQDKEIVKIIRQQMKAAKTPQEKESYKELVRDRKFAQVDVATMPVEQVRDIELLWAEYFVSGDLTAIKRIAEQVTQSECDIRKRIVQIAAISSLAQRGGWFAEVKSTCQQLADAASGTDQQTWNTLVGRMTPLDADGRVTIVCPRPTDRVQLEGATGRAMACGAAFVQRDHARQDVLAPYRNDTTGVQNTRKNLTEWWGITGRYELLTMLEWLVNEGHQQEFLALAERLEPMNGKQLGRLLLKQSESRQTQMKIVDRYAKQLTDTGIIAWDYTRIVLLARSGYQSHYLTAEETCALSIPVAIALQKTFDSWQAFGENLVIGRWFWRGLNKDRQAIETAVDELLKEPNGIWQKYPWEMPMP